MMRSPRSFLRNRRSELVGHQTHDHLTAHRRAVRWMHWFNFPLLTIMIWSGLRIYWADVRDPNVVGVGPVEIVTLFPSWFNSAFNLEAKLAAGLSYHLVFGWLFTLNGLAYAAYTVRSGHWKDLNPGRRGLIEALDEVKSTFTGKHQPDPEKGYNPAQRLAYNAIVFLGGLSVVTGLALFRPNTLWPLTKIFGGYQTAKDLHFIATLLFIGFFFIHVGQVLRAGRKTLYPMIAGPNPQILPVLTGLARRIKPRRASESEPQPIDKTQVGKSPQLASSNRRALLTAGVSISISALGWRIFQNQSRTLGLPDALRSGHELNEKIWRPADNRFSAVQTFEPSEANPIRVNGLHGLSEPLDVDLWKLQIFDSSGRQIGALSMEDIRELPETSMTTRHVCIEGWTEIVTWTGVRFSDFVERFADIASSSNTFVDIATPDNGYYVSIDIESALHPNTLLAYALNGEPLTEDHGAPLRLATPLKYGIKQIKRIGTITFADQPGSDFWTERGYDWYAHL